MEVIGADDVIVRHGVGQEQKLFTKLLENLLRWKKWLCILTETSLFLMDKYKRDFFSSYESIMF